jgi:hypothetical protein
MHGLFRGPLYVKLDLSLWRAIQPVHERALYVIWNVVMYGLGKEGTETHDWAISMAQAFWCLQPFQLTNLNSTSQQRP